MTPASSRGPGPGLAEAIASVLRRNADGRLNEVAPHLEGGRENPVRMEAVTARARPRGEDWTFGGELDTMRDFASRVQRALPVRPDAATHRREPERRLYAERTMDREPGNTPFVRDTLTALAGRPITYEITDTPGRVLYPNDPRPFLSYAHAAADRRDGGVTLLRPGTDEGTLIHEGGHHIDFRDRYPSAEREARHTRGLIKDGYATSPFGYEHRAMMFDAAVGALRSYSARVDQLSPEDRIAAFRNAAAGAEAATPGAGEMVRAIVREDGSPYAHLGQYAGPGGRVHLWEPSKNNPSGDPIGRDALDLPQRRGASLARRLHAARSP